MFENHCSRESSVHGGGRGWRLTIVSQLPCNLDLRLKWKWQKKHSVTAIWAYISTIDQTFVEAGAVPKTLTCIVSHFPLGHGSADEFYQMYHRDRYCCPGCWGWEVQVLLQGGASGLHAGECAGRTWTRSWEVNYQEFKLSFFLSG